ncbi:hypothetical protein [Pseudofulvibacter geojedonensis]|uniref:Uncharacterized protein n=1 Tax=Pseudofulvibacter geojedonensis TaxID=1123758 RepID=A0ABW3I5Y1_9FLAO
MGILLGIICLLCLSISFTSERENQKVTICHIPPGNPDNAHEITVSTNAVRAHLAHGDSIGNCPCDDDVN